MFRLTEGPSLHSLSGAVYARPIETQQESASINESTPYRLDNQITKNIMLFAWETYLQYKIKPSLKGRVPMVNSDWW